MAPKGGGRGRDAAPPRIDHEQIESAPIGRPLEVRATILDESGVFDPALLYRVDKRGSFLRLPMAPVDGEPDRFRAEIPAELVSDDLEYFIEAFDEQGNGPARFGDENVPVLVRVLKTAEPARAPDAAGTAPQDGATEVVPEDDGAGLWIGAAVAGGLVVLAAAATAGGVGYWYLTREDVPARVDVILRGPLPASSGARP